MKTLITAALPYANGPIHFGHIAGAYLPADCFSRFARLRGDDVLFLCGSDEYGVAISLKAEEASKPCQEYVDHFHAINKSLFQQLNIRFDHYSRTTNPYHIPFCQEFFLELVKNGFAETMESDQLFCEADGKFYADRYVTGTCPKCGFTAARGDECTKCGASFEAQELKNPKVKSSGKPLQLKKTTHWFLRLDKFKDQLQSWIAAKNWKPNVTNFIKGYIDDLRPRAITRDMKWGVPVPLPEGEGKVLYVWFDAPLGYITAAQEWSALQQKPDLWKEYWLNPETKLIQFIGKDNIPFHAVIFPSMIMGNKAAHYKLVDDLPANEFYNLEGQQFSKSDGWYIDLAEFLKLFDPELVRYAISSNAPETQDSEFTWKDFQLKVNSELCGKLGNFIHRTLTFAQQHCGGMIPKAHPLEAIDQTFLSEIKALASEAFTEYSKYRVRRACQVLMEIAQKANVYFDAKKPWHDAKQAETKARMETTISCCLEAIKILSLVASPILPNASQKAFKMITGVNPPIAWQDWVGFALTPGTALLKPETLFKKIEDKELDEAKKKLMPSLDAPKVVETPDNLISIDAVRNVELRVVKIISAERVEKSEKLLKLLVDTGIDVRQIIAGIGLHYKPEELTDLHTVAVTNLKPAKLMGLESHGMMLAAGHDKHLRLLTIAGMPAGTKVS